MTVRILQRQDGPALRYWNDCGEKPPVILIHGVGADGTNWDQIAAALAPAFRVLRLDLRGHGQSGHIEGALTLDDLVRGASCGPAAPDSTEAYSLCVQIMVAANASAREQRAAILAGARHELTSFYLVVDSLTPRCNGERSFAVSTTTLRPPAR